MTRHYILLHEPHHWWLVFATGETWAASAVERVKQLGARFFVDVRFCAVDCSSTLVGVRYDDGHERIDIDLLEPVVATGQDILVPATIVFTWEHACEREEVRE